MKTQTYTYNEKTVTVVDGKVTSSDFSYCVVGDKPDTKALKACGYLLNKTPAIYYAGGSKNPQVFGS
jgi:hypothetical protein